MFKTPRLLLELHVKDTWVPIKIYCNYTSVRSMLDHLPQFANELSSDVIDVRIKYLATHDQIADAKLAIYNRENRKKK